MGMERLGTYAEVWSVAGDPVGGLCLLDEDAWRDWRAGPIMDDSDPHAEVKALLSARGIRPRTEGGTLAYLHSTSWRPARFGLVVTYVAVIDVGGLVVDEWPAARPLRPRLAEAVGPPAPHASTERPEPRDIDVLWHALGHVRQQLRVNANARRDIPAVVQRQLELLDETFAGMYEVEYPQAA